MYSCCWPNDVLVLLAEAGPMAQCNVVLGCCSLKFHISHRRRRPAPFTARLLHPAHNNMPKERKLGGSASRSPSPSGRPGEVETGFFLFRPLWDFLDWLCEYSAPLLPRSQPHRPCSVSSLRARGRGAAPCPRSHFSRRVAHAPTSRRMQSSGTSTSRGSRWAASSSLTRMATPRCMAMSTTRPSRPQLSCTHAPRSGAWCWARQSASQRPTCAPSGGQALPACPHVRVPCPECGWTQTRGREKGQSGGGTRLCWGTGRSLRRAYVPACYTLNGGSRSAQGLA
jgi:hypothetical protein